MHGKTKNLREFFRVELKIPVFVRKIFYDSATNRYFYRNWEKFQSKNISGNGIFLFKNKKLSFKKDDYALIKFDLNNTNNYIYILAKIVREDSDGYAFTYILVDENRIDEIVREFLRLEYERVFKDKEQL